MTNRILQRDQYKLETIFAGNTTTHIVRKGQRGVNIRKSWNRRKKLGSGAFGVVWLEEEEEGQSRAVKIMPRDNINVDWARELSILAQVRKHEELFVQFLGWYEDKNFVYFAMEYIQHGDLGQYLEKSGLEVARSQAKRIVTQILTGLVILHKQNICHRDIKPKNILIASTSPIQVKIADFGLSKDQNNTSLRTGCGTSYYTAPEVHRLVPMPKNKRSYTNLVDVWSMGILTHEILTSKVLFLEDPDSDSEMRLGKGPESPLMSMRLPLEGPDSDSDMRSGKGRESPLMSMGLFLDYCRDPKRFPMEALQNSGVDDNGIAFVKALLVTDPQSRISAEKALENCWLQEAKEEIKEEMREMGKARQLKEEVREIEEAREMEKAREIEEEARKLKEVREMEAGEIKQARRSEHEAQLGVAFTVIMALALVTVGVRKQTNMHKVLLGSLVLIMVVTAVWNLKRTMGTNSPESWYYTKMVLLFINIALTVLMVLVLVAGSLVEEMPVVGEPAVVVVALDALVVLGFIMYQGSDKVTGLVAAAIFVIIIPEISVVVTWLTWLGVVGMVGVVGVGVLGVVIVFAALNSLGFEP